MKKATLNLRAKLWTNVAKQFVLLLVFLLGNLPLSMAQNNVILASANQNRSFQAKSTYALKEVLTDIGEHYKVKIAYETDLVRDLTVSDYPRFSSQDVVVVLKKVLNEVNLDIGCPIAQKKFGSKRCLIFHFFDLFDGNKFKRVLSLFL